MGKLDDAAKGLLDLPGKLIDDLDDAVKGLSDDLLNVIQDGATNLINQILKLDDALKQLYQMITKDIWVMLLKMFKDPKFWKGVLMFMGLVIAAEALAFSSQFPAGMRWGAFCEKAGLVFHKTGMGFLVKTHRLAYLVSPKYQKGFADFIAPEIEKLAEAGVDIGTAASLIGNMWGLGRSIGVMLGQDWEASRESWDVKMQDFGQAIAKNAKEWGEDPEKLVEWLDKNLIADDQNKAAKFFNTLAKSADWILDTGDKLAGRFEDIQDKMGDVAKDLETLGYENIAEKFREGETTIGDLFLTQWKEISKQITDVRNIVEIETIQTTVSAAVVGGMKTSGLRESIYIMKGHNK